MGYGTNEVIDLDKRYVWAKNYIREKYQGILTEQDREDFIQEYLIQVIRRGNTVSLEYVFIDFLRKYIGGDSRNKSQERRIALNLSRKILGNQDAQAVILETVDPKTIEDDWKEEYSLVRFTEFLEDLNIGGRTKQWVITQMLNYHQ